MDRWGGRQKWSVADPLGDLDRAAALRQRKQERKQELAASQAKFVDYNIALAELAELRGDLRAPLAPLAAPPAAAATASACERPSAVT